MPLRKVLQDHLNFINETRINLIDCKSADSRYDWQLSNLGAAETPGRPSRTLLVDVNASLIACVPFRTPWGGFAAVPPLPPPILPRLKCRRGNNNAATHETKRKTFRITRFATISFSNIRSVNSISSGFQQSVANPWFWFHPGSTKSLKAEAREHLALVWLVLISKHHFEFA